MIINKFLFLIILSFFLLVNNNNILNVDAYGFGIAYPNATCQNYIGDPGQQICDGKLRNNNLIYSEKNGSQIVSLITAEKTFASLTFLQSKCPNINFAQFGFCNMLFPPCTENSFVNNNTGIEVKVYLPKRICNSICTEIVSQCPYLAPSLNCSNQNIFPKDYTLYNISMYTGISDPSKMWYPVQCENITDLFISNPGHVSEVCVAPLLLRNSSDSKYSSDRGYTYLTPTNCVLPCPAPYYTKNKWHQMYLMSKIVSTISFVCCLYNIGTFGILNKHISKYNYCIVFFSASVALMNLMDIVTYGIGYEKVLCPEPGRFSTQDDVTCGVTGSLFHFGVTSGVLWWTTMAIYLLAVVKRIKMIDFRIFVIFNTVFAIVMLIIPLSGKAIMAGTGSLACWIRKEWYVNGVFWIPLGLCLFVGSFCIIMVIFQIYKISKNVSKDNKILKLQLKPFLCVTLIGGSFFYLFIFNFDNTRHMDQYKASIAGYVQCLLAGGNEDTCTSEGPNFAAYFVFYFFIRLFGIIFFCIYGTSENARNIWIHSAILNHPAIKPFLLRYSLVNFNSVTVFGSGMAATTNSKTMTSKKGTNSERGIEMDSVTASKGHTISVSKVDETVDSKNSSGMDSSDS